MRNTLLVLSGLLLAIMLAGCSSGGDGGAVNELTADVETLEMDLESARAELATTKADLEDTEDDLATAQAALVTARTTLSTTQADLTTAQAELATAKDDLEEAESDLEDAQTELATAKSDLETANATLTTLRSTQTTTQADLEEAREDLATAQAALQMARATLAMRTTDLTAAQTQVTQLRATVTSLRTQLGQAQDTTEDLQEEITELESGVSSLEANTRAENMRMVLEGAVAGSPRVQAAVRTRGSLAIEAPNYTGSTVSGGATGFSMATLTRTAGGSQQKIVAYTDREVSRTLLGHYGSSRHNAQGTRDHDGVQILASGATLATSTNVAAPAASDPDWRVTNHGFAATIAEDATDRTPTNTPTTVSGSFRGVPGTFRCAMADCEISLSATYTANDPDNVTTTENRLDTVTFDAVTDLYFRPSSPSSLIYLYPGGDYGTDSEYVVFGWWKNTPEVITGAYDFEVFSMVTGTPETVVTGSYDGPAVGVYVERIFLSGEAGGARHGEFTATAHLSGNGTVVTGYVDGFRATQEGSGTAVAKNWRVNFGDTSNDVQIRLAGLDRTAEGGWTVGFLPNRTGSGFTEPLTGAGTFDVSVESLHVAGAYGVRRTSPQPAAQ